VAGLSAVFQLHSATASAEACIEGWPNAQEYLGYCAALSA